MEILLIYTLVSSIIMMYLKPTTRRLLELSDGFIEYKKNSDDADNILFNYSDDERQVLEYDMYKRLAYMIIFYIVPVFITMLYYGFIGFYWWFAAFVGVILFFKYHKKRNIEFYKKNNNNGTMLILHIVMSVYLLLQYFEIPLLRI